MTDKGLNSLLSDSFKMGADASVAAGPVGAGAQADVVTDLVTYSHAKGIYGGINLDGIRRSRFPMSGTKRITARKGYMRRTSWFAAPCTPRARTG